MLWICRECGIEFPSDDELVVALAGWTSLDGDTGICPDCAGALTGGIEGSRLRRAEDRRRRSQRALSVTRALLDRSRRPPWNEAALEAAADRLGFEPEICPACRSANDRRCPNCEGNGIVWRQGATSLTAAGLLRLAMWPDPK